jgi:hypothetical protein
MGIEEVVLVLVVIGLAVVAVRGVVSRSGRARWAYAAGLVAGAGLGVGIALETGGLWTLGLAIGLGASVVGAAAVEAVTARIRGPVRHVPRRPGHDEDV